MANERILLVEDNSKLVQFLLECTGNEVIEARTGQQGMGLTRAEKPDMILMDLSLPEEDGWTAARELKADPQTASKPIYALTAHTLPGNRSRTLESGSDEYLFRPVNVQSFGTSIAECLKG